MRATVRFFSLMICLVFCMSLAAQEKKVPKEMFGKWGFVMENPQTGESYNGLCDIAESGDKVTAYFDLGMGEGVETSGLVLKDDGKCHAEMDIQGYIIGTIFSKEGDKFVCEFDAGDFAFSVDLTKKE